MRIKLLLMVLTATFLAGCSSRAQEGKVIAEVNGQKLTYEYLLDQIPKEYQATMTDEDIAKAIDTWVDMELLYQEAVKHNIDKDKHVLNTIDQTKKSIIARKYLEAGLDNKMTPTEAEIDSLYQQEKDKFTNNEPSYHLGHIVLKNQKAADAVYSRLKSGEDFAKMAGDYSEDTLSMKKGGDIGFLPASSLEKEMVAALNTTDIGGYTRPIPSQGGYYHIFQLKEKRDSGAAAPLSEVRNDIIQAITSQKQQAAYDSLISGLKTKAQIKRYPLSDSKEKK
jgi:EpsD family peptidyl-prolyl cis-trans isomerase